MSVKSPSLLGFGCAPIMGKISRRQALRALSIAYDLGVTHFDIARSYGFGEAETVLGEFISNKRNKVTITTKYGVVPPKLRPYQKAAKPVIRVLRNNLKLLGNTISNVSAGLLNERKYNLKYANECLELSLRKLNCDQIDYFLIHDPAPEVLTDIDELNQFMEESIAAGKIGKWGIASSQINLSDEFSKLGSVIQKPSDVTSGKISTDDICSGAKVRFITQPFGGIGKAVNSELLCQITKNSDYSLESSAVMLAAFQANTSGSVIAGMFTEEHIRKNIASIESYINNKAEIDGFIKTLINKHYNG